MHAAKNAILYLVRSSPTADLWKLLEWDPKDDEMGYDADKRVTVMETHALADNEGCRCAS